VTQASIIRFEAIDSTNRFCERNYRTLKDTTFVIAQKQTTGKGRLNREWASPAGGLWFSVFFKTRQEELSLLQPLVSLSVLKVINHYVPGERFRLKWPNDIVHGSGKVAGILQKNIHTGAGIYSIIGTGINVNNPVPDELKEKAISLRGIAGHEIPLDVFSIDIMDDIRRKRRTIDRNRIMEEYHANSLFQQGDFVRFKQLESARIYEGYLTQVPFDRIIIRTKKLETFSFRAGDVSFSSGK